MTDPDYLEFWIRGLETTDAVTHNIRTGTGTVTRYVVTVLPVPVRIHNTPSLRNTSVLYVHVILLEAFMDVGDIIYRFCGFYQPIAKRGTGRK